MAPKTSTADKEDRRAQIFAAATKLFKRYGFQKTTMQDIARAAGMAVGTLYLYYKNKDQIMAEAAREFAVAHQRQIAEILHSTMAPDQKLRRYIKERFIASAQTREENSHAEEIVRALLRVYPERLEEESMMMFDTISQILEQGSEQGVFRVSDIKRDAEVFLYAVSWFYPLEQPEFYPAPDLETLLKIVDWFLEKWRG